MHLSIYCFIFLVTPSYQKFQVTNSTVFHCPLCPPTSISWYSLIISALNILFLGIYTFLSLYIMPSTSFYFLSLSISTPTRFIFSTILTTSSSFTFDFLTFSNRSTPSTITSTCYQGTVNVLSGHPRWMFRKNSMEFFVGLQPYLYYYYSGCTLESHGHMSFPECSMVT